MKAPEFRLAGSFATMPQEPWHPKRARRNAKPFPWSYSTTDKWAPLQAWSQNSGELRPPTKIFLSLQTNYYELLQGVYLSVYFTYQILKKVPYKSHNRNFPFWHKIGKILHLLHRNELVETFLSTDLFVFCLTTVPLALT